MGLKSCLCLMYHLPLCSAPLQIVFVEDAEITKVLAKEIPLCLLPKELGGQAELPSLWEKYGQTE